MDLSKYIARVDNFPQPGIVFRDITPLLNDGAAFNYAIQEMTKFAKKVNAQLVAGPESRGFIFGCPIACLQNIGFVPIRKKGKLPRPTKSFEYNLEYGTNTLQIHVDAIKPGQRVLICDDLLATGGTIEASIKLIQACGGIVAGLVFLVELAELNGRSRLVEYPLLSLITY
jgi:adenine phosphoribosyltransferase